MINPFVICSTEEIAALRAYVDREMWVRQCRLLGATDEQAKALDRDAQRYARATPYPNETVVAYVRRSASTALLRGEPWPASAEAAIEAGNAREWARIVDRLR